MTLSDDQRHDAAPRSRLTLQVRRDVTVDRVMFRLVAGRAARPPDPALIARIAGEVADAADLFGRRGWLADPASYHPTPPPPEGIRTRPTSSRGLKPTIITWDDGYRCDPDEPGALRYAGYTANRIARAAVLEHRSGSRPWLVCIHGFGMGTPGIDLRGFRAAHLYRDLGLNLAFLTLPFHGRRRVERSALPRFPGIDVLDNVHGLAQAVWDVRQLVLHLQERTDQPIGIAGMSLGGCVAALVASLADVHAALLLIPAVDLATLMTDAAERRGLTPNVELAERAQRVMLPVSPLALTPRVPVDRRVIVAGTLDQFVRPAAQAVALLRHWDEPEVHWYHGGHVSLFWDRRARAGIDASLRRIYSLEARGED